MSITSTNTWTLSLSAALLLLVSSSAHAQEKVDDDAKVASSPPAAAPRASVDDSAQSVELRGLEEKVNDLKEKIFRSKARLMLLRETVLSGVISGAKAVLYHRNEMGSSFTLERVSYSLDGTPLLNKTDTDGDVNDKEQIELFSGGIVPGNHNLSVYLEYRGNGYGVFSYLRGYTFKIKSSYAFTAEEGKICTVKAVAYEKGGVTTDLKDRPAIRYDVEFVQDVAAAPAATSAPDAAASEHVE